MPICTQLTGSTSFVRELRACAVGFRTSCDLTARRFSLKVGTPLRAGLIDFYGKL